ncbi:hypothetical protein Q4I32_003856 [Leishmania shawi]|uniref:Uncharacterized protein n=1 Tax=Leishmania shawi TaxID=5680 RepID=A0AAW3BVB5_9TRYP
MSAPQMQSAEDEIRIAAARAKAEAARLAVERRRSMNSDGVAEKSNCSDTRNPQSPGAAADFQRRSSFASSNGALETAGEGMVGDHHINGASAASNDSCFPQPGETDAAHPQTPEEYAAAIEAMRQECERIALNDESLEKRLQLYSEVVGLRKELAIVQEDEERLRQQLATAEVDIAASDMTVEKVVTIFEDEAKQCALQKVWVEESKTYNPETMDWADIDVNNLHQRVEVARKKFMEAVERADALYVQQQDAINETTDAREREKATLAENYEREMGDLMDARTHARQLASEKRFHRRRGTAKASPTVPIEKECAMRQHRIDEDEFRTTAQVGTMKDELAELMEQVKVLKRQLDDSRQATEAKFREYEASLKVVEEEGADARELKERLLKEEEELKELRVDLQAVLHYVRAKNREEEGW